MDPCDPTTGVRSASPPSVGARSTAAAAAAAGSTGVPATASTAKNGSTSDAKRARTTTFVVADARGSGAQTHK